MALETLLTQRAQKDDFFRSSPQSPLTPEQQDGFKGLRYYPPNPALAFEVELEAVEGERGILIETTTGEMRRYERAGRIQFMVDGEVVSLIVYETPHGYFLPFTDANAGTETYPAGRYLEPEELGGGKLYVDFNLAYQPYCAYGDGWSCPITPVENRLSVAIRAGEMIGEDKTI